MESRPQNPQFRNNPVNFPPMHLLIEAQHNINGCGKEFVATSTTKSKVKMTNISPVSALCQYKC